MSTIQISVCDIILIIAISVFFWDECEKSFIKLPKYDLKKFVKLNTQSKSEVTKIFRI